MEWWQCRGIRQAADDARHMIDFTHLLVTGVRYVDVVYTTPRAEHVKHNGSRRAVFTGRGGHSDLLGRLAHWSAMKTYPLRTLAVTLGATAVGMSSMVVDTLYAAPPAPYLFTWSTVVNNNDYMPTADCVDGQPANSAAKCRHFNSYNQPSVNVNGLVVIRARSRGGEGGAGDGGEGGGGNGDAGSGSEGHQPVHGIYTRDMSNDMSDGDVESRHIVRILDRTSEVPQPNNLGSTFIETPSFPRIDMWSDTVATRGNHQPVWEYALPDGGKTRAGTTGIYTNPFGGLISGASKLGALPDFSFFEVPGAPTLTPFDVFPGAPGGDRRQHHRVQRQLHGGWLGRERSLPSRPSGGLAGPRWRHQPRDADCQHGHGNSGDPSVADLRLHLPAQRRERPRRVRRFRQ